MAAHVLKPEPAQAMTRALQRAFQSVMTTFLTATLIYVANHSTELHITPWYGAMATGLAATISAVFPKSGE